MAWRAVYSFGRVNEWAFLRKKKTVRFEKFCYHKLVLVFVFTKGLAKMPCSHRMLKNIVRFLVIFKDNWLVNLLVKKNFPCSIHFLSIALRSRLDYQQLFRRGDRTGEKQLEINPTLIPGSPQ